MAGEDPQYRIRVGNYRIVYEVYDRELLVLVIRVAHRSSAYRR
jgi:mRNA interferase RelE/StbE